MNTQQTPLAVLILAAGKGKRMNNPELPKVMFPVAGTPMVGHILNQVRKLSPDKTVLIVGHHKEIVIDYVNEDFAEFAEFAEQNEQLGTGHAVAQAEELLKDFSGDVLILSGDVPLLRASTLKTFVETHHHTDASVSVLSVDAPNPTGYGRIVRDEAGNFLKITEQKDATDAEKAITEINSGIYIVESEKLFKALKQVSNTNAQGEYYLTDIIAILRRDEAPVCAVKVDIFDELQGINTVDELARAEQSYHALHGETVSLPNL